MPKLTTTILSNSQTSNNNQLEGQISRPCCPLPQTQEESDWTKFCWGWEDYYQNTEPASKDLNYLRGWQQAKNVSSVPIDSIR